MALMNAIPGMEAVFIDDQDTLYYSEGLKQFAPQD